MLRQIIGKKTIERDSTWLDQQLASFSEVITDIGTGDAKFAYDYAKSHPETFVIAIDADAQALQELSAKADKKPIKGGLNNFVCIWAAAESLPAELENKINHIYINFPWGSLLGGVAKAEELISQNLTSIASKDAEMEINFTYHQAYEPTVVSQLQLPELNQTSINELAQKYLIYGWKLISAAKLNNSEIEELSQSWAKRITSQRQREVWRLKFAKVSQ